MAKVMIWPDLYREHGHWLPCVSLAKSLKAAGHTVEFLGIPDCAAIVAPYQATFRTVLGNIYPLGHSVDDRLEPKGQRWKPHHLLPITRGALDGVFGSAASPPDLLVAGYFTALEALMIHHKYGIPLVIVTTYLRHPDDTPLLHAKTKLVYMPRALGRKLIDGVSATGTLTLDQFVDPLRDVEEMIPCAREFDFTDPDWQHGAHTSYVEPMILREPLDGSTLPNNVPGIPTDKRLIYATVGSQVQDYEVKAKVFFRNLMAMMQTSGMSNYHLVLAVGSKLYAEFQKDYGADVDLGAVATNIGIFDWVSQLDILAQADVVYTHGGLATIKESIWETVPIVIVPHGKDQVDNALRITRAGLGVVAEAEGTSPQNLRKLLTQATASTWVKRSLTKMQSVFAATELSPTKPSVTIVNAALSG